MTTIATARRVLFHGTTTKFKPGIKRHGVLLPRSRTGKACYDGKLLSEDDRVYLSDVYAVAFARNAVEKHGGNMMLCKCVVDEELLLPDSDFQDGGAHRLNYDDGDWRTCLEETGCVSVRGPVPVRHVWTVKGKMAKELKDCLLRIETGLRHRAFYRQHMDLLESLLMYSEREELEAAAK